MLQTKQPHLSLKKYYWLLAIFSISFLWSAISPHDYFTWFLEVFPAIIGLVILSITFKNFRFTYFTYCFILIHCIILFVGGHYTYAEVPLFNTIKEYFHQSRNNYDKLGHFTQGFVPALIVRELFIRRNIVKKGNWLAFLTVCVCVSISAFYEFLEWFVAVRTGESADSFLGTQGYVWDTQADMLYATSGAALVAYVVGKIQDKRIAKLESEINR